MSTLTAEPTLSRKRIVQTNRRKAFLRIEFLRYIAGAGIGFKPTGDDIHPEVSAAVELNLKNPPEEKKDSKE